MGNGQGEQHPGANLRGWLSDVYFPALIEGTLGPLAQRLGARATVDDPILGRAAGLSEIESHLAKTAAWLRGSSASYERGQFTTGVDRDVTEGLLTMTKDGRTFDVPVAVVAERHRSRAVEVRIYHATQPLGAKAVCRPLAPPETVPVAPAVIAEHQDALRRADITAALACFEEQGTARDGIGSAFGKADGALARFHETICGGGWTAILGGYADDGRTVALENTLARFAGHDVPAQANLMVYERGDSGLVRALRMYGDVTR
jgi:hypothetical protein